MLNIVIPMAGRGSRFVDAGYEMPKPLIDVNGKSMIEIVTDNIRPTCDYRFIYVCLQEHMEKYNLEKILRNAEPECVIIPITAVTDGAACTVLLAESYINNSDALMIANSDQYVDINIDDYIQSAASADGLVMTMKAHDAKWSYIRYDSIGNVIEVREKAVISEEATVGIYNFSHGFDFVKYAREMIDADERSKGEFYVAPVYNRMTKDGKTIKYMNVGKVGDGMYGLGTPEDLRFFLKMKKTGGILG